MSEITQSEVKPAKLGVMPAPHMHWGRTIPSVMTEICIALLPALIMSIYNFGPSALMIIGLSVASAVTTEALCLHFMKQDIHVDDFHAVYIGVLLAFMLPAEAPWWLPVVGSALSIGLGKMIFGGLGSNPFCPPAIGWAILMVCWPTLVDATTVLLNNELLDPLYHLKYFGVEKAAEFSYQSLLMGHQMGGLGTTQTGALLVGGVFLALRTNIAVETPLGFILGIYILGGIMHYCNPALYPEPTFHVLAGSAIFGAFFLATEFGGSPSRPIPRLLYGMFAGMMTIVIRTFGIYADGVPFAILLANLITPYLDLIRPKPFGA